MNELTKMPYAAMNANIDVSMDDVVSAFVATYETKLFTRKKQLSADIENTNKAMEKLDKEALNAVDGDEFVVTDITPFDLASKIEDKSINWEIKQVLFNVKVYRMKDNNTRHSYYSSCNYILIEKKLPIPPEFVKQHKVHSKVLEKTRAQLSETLDEIKSITRKERQVRGKIAIRKLEAQGYANLMEDPELKALVQLPE
jgi:hypothetical protein